MKEQWEMSVSDLVDWANQELGLSDSYPGEDERPVTKRTIHYYIGLGLLPPPSGTRSRAVYGAEHRERLMAIKLLKNAYLPLKEIRARLEGLSLEQVSRLAGQLSASDALPLGQTRSRMLSADAMDEAPPEPERPEAPSVEQSLNFWSAGRPIRRRQPERPTARVWQREELAPGVELHFQLTDDAALKLEVDRLISHARKRFRNWRES